MKLLLLEITRWTSVITVTIEEITRRTNAFVCHRICYLIGTTLTIELRYSERVDASSTVIHITFLTTIRTFLIVNLIILIYIFYIKQKYFNSLYECSHHNNPRDMNSNFQLSLHNNPDIQSRSHKSCNH